MTTSPDSAQEAGLTICGACQTSIDVSDFEPLTQVACPNCGNSLSTGNQVGPYRLVSVAGRGGMGIVYKAVDSSLDRFVAIKLLRRDRSGNQTLVDQLANEASITAAVTHPNVCRVFATGTDQGRFYIVMELVDKGSLQDLMNLQQKVAETQLLEIAIQIASGLRAAHQFGLVHRDVKPGNILFSDATTAKIVDFGLAIFMEQAEASNGEIWGTPYYIAPEKLDGHTGDFRSDIYSFGATLYHALAGRPPFEAETASLVALKHLKNQPVSLQAFAPWVSNSTAYVINRTLAKDPNERYDTYNELIQHLEYAKDELQKRAVEPASTNRRVVLETAGTQKAMGWITFAMIGLIIAIVVGGFVYHSKSNSQQSAAAATTSNSPSVTVQPPAENEFRRAADLLGAGDAARAADAFHQIASSSTTQQPDTNWAMLCEGIANLVADKRDAARASFQKLSERGLFSTRAEDAQLGTFFFTLGKKMASDEKIESSAVSGLNLKSHEAIATLAYGIKDWQTGKMEDATTLLRQFRSSNIIGDESWIEALKPLAGTYLDQYNEFQQLAASYRTTSNPDARGQIASKLQQLPGALGMYATAFAEATPAPAAVTTPPAAPDPAQADPSPAVVPSIVASYSPDTGKSKRDSGAAKKTANLKSHHKGDHLENFSPAPPPGPNITSLAQIRPGVLYKITNRLTLKSLDVDSGGLTDNTSVLQYLYRDDGSGPNQQWTLMAAQDGTYSIIARHSTKALQLNGAPGIPGATLVQFTPNNSDLQKWFIKSVGGDSFKIISKAGGMVVTAVNSGTDSMPITVVKDAKLPEQEWQIAPLE